MTIGVCGGSGSGKTTMARRLVDALGADRAAYLSFDSYYRDHSHLTVEQRAAVNFDHPDSLDVELLIEHLRALRAGTEVAVPVYDFSTHTRSGDLEMVAPKDFVVIEGILLFAFEAIRDELDFMIFRDCPEPVRAERRIERDIVERGRTPESVREQWATTVRPMHDVFVQPYAKHADIVTEHGDELEDLLPSLVAAIHRERSAAVEP
ncbi:MAG: uridine kinase [Actinomycetota bacterium]